MQFRILEIRIKLSSKRSALELVSMRSWLLNLPYFLDGIRLLLLPLLLLPTIGNNRVHYFIILNSKILAIWFEGETVIKMKFKNLTLICVHLMALILCTAATVRLDKDDEPLLTNIFDLCTDYGFLKYSLIYSIIIPYRKCLYVRIIVIHKVILLILSIL